MYTFTISRLGQLGHDRSRLIRASYWIAGVGLLGGALVWTYWLVIPALVAQWWNEPEYSHGFLVPVIAGYLAWNKRDTLKALPLTPGYWGLALMGLALLTYITGSVGADLFLQRLSLVMMIAGSILYIAGWAILQALIFPIGFLLLMIPLPGIVFNSDCVSPAIAGGAGGQLGHGILRGPGIP